MPRIREGLEYLDDQFIKPLVHYLTGIELIPQRLLRNLFNRYNLLRIADDIGGDYVVEEITSIAVLHLCQTVIGIPIKISIHSLKIPNVSVEQFVRQNIRSDTLSGFRRTKYNTVKHKTYARYERLNYPPPMRHMPYNMYEDYLKRAMSSNKDRARLVLQYEMFDHLKPGTYESRLGYSARTIQRIKQELVSDNSRVILYDL